MKCAKLDLSVEQGGEVGMGWGKTEAENQRFLQVGRGWLLSEVGHQGSNSSPSVIQRQEWVGVRGKQYLFLLEERKACRGRSSHSEVGCVSHRPPPHFADIVLG